MTHKQCVVRYLMHCMTHCCVHYACISQKCSFNACFNALLSFQCTKLWMCSFMGWITNFISQRYHAAASCAYAYSRLNFVRRMPPFIRTRLQERQQHHTMNTSMRGFISPYVIPQGRGSGELYVKPENWRNNRGLLDEDRVPLRRYTLTRYTTLLIFQHISLACRSISNMYISRLVIIPDSTLQCIVLCISVLL